jgi:hypothetical protein
LFDVYDLRFPASSMEISNFTFSGNTIKAKKSSGNLTIVRINDDYDVNAIDIIDNIIELGTKADQPFNLVKMVNVNEDQGSIRHINITNNNISAPFGYLLYNVFADEINVADNTIIDNGNGYSGFAYNGRFIRSNISNNNIDSRNYVSFYEGRQLYGDGTKREALNISRKNLVSGDNGMHLDLNYSSDTPTTYKRSYTFNSSEGKYEFYYSFTLSHNPDLKCAEVTFTNNKGETKTYRLGEKDTSLNGNGQYIELVGKNEVKMGQIPFRVRFFNNKDGAGFYITEYNSSYAELKIETISQIQSDN